MANDNIYGIYNSFQLQNRCIMSNYNMFDLIYINTPMFVAMAVIYVMLSMGQRRHYLSRKPQFVRDIHRSAHMDRILDGGVHKCIEYI